MIKEIPCSPAVLVRLTMVFSFFKKQPEKMITRQAAVPKPAVDGKQAASDPRETKPEAVQVAPAPVAEDGYQSVSFDDNKGFGLTESSLDFNVSTELDPINEPAEEAAILFADNQDKAAQAVLENALRSLPPGSAERLWMMLFDLYRLSGQRPAFEATGIEYARSFEKSPPAWGGAHTESTSKVANEGSSMLFRGDLLAKNTAAFDAVGRELEKGSSLRLDLAKVKQLDPGGCEALLDLVARARKGRGKLNLLGRDSLIKLLMDRIEAGREDPVPGKAYWLLLLELLKQQGRQDVFEDKAVDYAVTFEESPPSWEAGRVVKSEPAKSMATQESREEVVENNEAYPLSGEIRSTSFSDLTALAKDRNVLLIDCSNLKRIDFSSTGALLNALVSVHRVDKKIYFRHPNYLVSELFRIVGLDALATIINTKY